MNPFNSPRRIDDRAQSAADTDPIQHSRYHESDQPSEEQSSRHRYHHHHHHHQYDENHAYASQFIDRSRSPRAHAYQGLPHYSSSQSYHGSSLISRHPGYYEQKPFPLRQQNQYQYSEEPSSPPRFHRRPPPPSHNLAFSSSSRQTPNWQEQNRGTPTRSNRQPKDYSYHPSESFQRSPSSHNESPYDTEFVGRRFIPTDAPHPPSLPMAPPLPALLPPPPRQTKKPPAQASPNSKAKKFQEVAIKVAMHPGSRGDYIWETRAYDVLCGRGVPTAHQWGNHLFKCLVKERQIEYISCERNNKSRLAMEIMSIIDSYHGRFLRRVKVPDRQERFAWVELTEQRAYEKVCQALRDGGPRIREAMLAITAKEKEDSNADKENVVNGRRRDNR